MPQFIPAHRVVNRAGVLSGKHHFGGSSVMQQLLENEGIKVVEDKVVGFEKLYWEPY
jgi:methylated-DNA-protein-cysteine methyltransferase-like protein